MSFISVGFDIISETSLVIHEDHKLLDHDWKCILYNDSEHDGTELYHYVS